MFYEQISYTHKWVRNVLGTFLTLVFIVAGMYFLAGAPTESASYHLGLMMLVFAIIMLVLRLWLHELDRLMSVYRDSRAKKQKTQETLSA